MLTLGCTDNKPVLIEDKGRVWIGSAGAAYNRDELLKHGITHIICAAQNLVNKFPDDFVYKRVDIQDKASEDLASYLPGVLEFMESALNADPRNNVLVHCFQGRSRSAAIIAAYLLHTREDYRLQDAMDTIRKNRPNACPNVGFCVQLINAYKDRHVTT